MIGQKQKIVDPGKGDCFRACIASILEVENDDKLPNSHRGDWLAPWHKYFNKQGLRLGYNAKAIWREGYWIASVPSKNYKGVTHSIVMLDSNVAFDPSTKKKYRKGRSLVGKDIARFGYWIELSDISKFKKYLKKFL